MSSAPSPTRRAIALSAVNMSKHFGSFTALDAVSLDVPAGQFHVLLGENGAGKSTLVKCIMGFYQPDEGSIVLDGKTVTIRNPRDARAFGIGMVYQQFTLVPSLTGAENLVISRADTPAIIDWRRERERLAAFMARMPFKVPLDRPVASFAAGEKQKLEILKLLYLDQRFLILDEPTSVLTPDEADEVLGLLRGMTQAGDITVLMISHKFREVTAFADAVSVLRRGALAGSGKVADLSTNAMARMMIGDTIVRERAARTPRDVTAPGLELSGISADDETGRPAVQAINLTIGRGEIVGIAGVSGNGQTALVEVLNGQRRMREGRIIINGKPFEPVRRDFSRCRVYGLPEEPLKNTAVPRMSVAENMAFRIFDTSPVARFGMWLSPAPVRARAATLVERYKVKTASVDAPIETLSGGNVQRAVLARELSGEVDVLIVANPCFGLDFASAAEIRAQVMDQRNRGAAVLLVSEDLDEILELADRVAVMSEGRISYLAAIGETDRTTIGHHMAGH
jgi:ABC-type uncharacterized transport system ATPase subunit